MTSYPSRFKDNSGLVERTIASYDQYAESFLRKHGDFLPTEAFMEIEKHIKYGSKILDVGCGLGRDTHFLIERGYPTIGIDMSIGMLRTGQENYHFPAIQGDLRYLPFAAGSFDAIWAVASVIHIPRGEIVKTLQEFKRVVNNGYIYISVIKGKGEQADSGDEGLLQRGWRYFVFYELDDLSLLLEQTGLKIESNWERLTQRRRPWKGSPRDWLHVIARSSGSAQKANPVSQNLSSEEGDVLEMLRCPSCVQKEISGPGSRDTEQLRRVGNSWLACQDCGRKYPITDGIPVMLIEEGNKWIDVPTQNLLESSSTE